MQTKKEENLEQEKSKRKVSFSTFIYAFLIIGIFIFSVMSILAYGTNTQIGKRIAAAVSRVIPFPAVIIGYTNVISLGEVERNLASVKSFYEKQDLSSAGIRIDFSTDDGKKRLKIKEKEVLNKMLEDEIIQNLAQKKGIFIDQATVDIAVSRKLDEYGTKDSVEKDLQNLYGWDMDDFKQKVVFPSMYQEKLQKEIQNEIILPEEAKKKIAQAKLELENGKDFTQVAQKYSEGASGEKGGEIGWVTKDQLVPELQIALFDNAVENDKNSILESELGFHIVDIEEKKKNNDKTVIRIRQIFVRKQGFSDWLNNKMKNMKIYVPLSDFYWDKQNATIEFRDHKLKEFEQNLLEKSQGDVSVMF